MTFKTANSFSAPAILAFISLSACGGGGGGSTQNTPDSALFTASSPDVTLDVSSLNRATDVVSTQTTALNAPSTLVGGVLAGTVSYSYETGASNFITLSGGKTAAIDDRATTVSFMFANADIVGVAGVAATNMPSSSTASYSGHANAVVNDGNTITQLTSSTVTANFSSDLANISLSGDGRWLRINDANINGTRITGGNVSVSSDFANAPATSGDLDHAGQFFGVGASEVGGTFIIDKTDNGTSFKAQGVYNGAR